MSSIVDIHAKDIAFETIQTELRLHPWRLEEKRVRQEGVDDVDVGNTPLMSAAKAGHAAVVVFLLSLGANIQATNEVLAVCQGH